MNHEYLLKYALKLNPFKSPLLAEIAAMVVVVIVSAALAYVTFRLIEKPFLQMRDTHPLFGNQKLSKPATVRNL